MYDPHYMAGAILLLGFDLILVGWTVRWMMNKRTGDSND